MSSPKIHLLTFGAGPEYGGSLAKIHEEAQSVPLFDEIHVWNEGNVRDSIFWDKHKEFISANPRGWGYWIWKSFVTLKLLTQIGDNDIIVYMDAGCQLNINDRSLSRLQNYVDIVSNSPYGILSFSLRYFTDSRFTKMDVAQTLDATEFMDSKQLVGGVYVVRKCDHVLSLFNEFYDICSSQNYHLIDDSPSVATNAPDFQEHRHDQSVFSLLRKKRGTEIIEDETFWGPPFFDWKQGHIYPIWARRRKIP